MSRIQYPIQDLVPGIWLTEFGKSDFFTYNPSILRYNGQNIMAYRVSTRHYGLNQSATCLLDDQWRLIPDSPRPLFDPQSPECPEHAEDVRLFEHEGSLWAIFNDSKRPNLLYLAQIDPVSRQAAGHPRPLILNERNILEKNWMPFSHAGQLWVLYSICPHTILSLDLNHPHAVRCERVSAIDWDDEGIGQHFGPWHGGNAPTLHDGLFWVFPHMVAQTSFLGDLTAPLRKWVKRHKKSAPVTFENGDVRPQQQPFAEWFPYQTHLPAHKIWLARLKRHFLFRHYVLGVYAFESSPPFTPRVFSYRPILRASQEQAQHREPLVLDRPQVVFAAGAIIQADGAWQVSYGLHDDFCIIRTFSPEDLLRHCRPIKVLKSNDFHNSKTPSASL